MGLPKRKTDFPTTEAFLAWEEAQPDKHEYIGGEVFAMVGARRVHVAVAFNTATLLKSHLRGTPCRAFISDMKLDIGGDVFYPDVLVTCHPADLAADLAMRHPKVIVEVLSESTAACDRGQKFAAYRRIAELEEYALIDPERRSIEVFRRTDSGDWLLMASEAERGLVLRSIDFVASAAAVFEDVGENEPAIADGGSAATRDA
jgi:Uma2 family endonuclease